jgi:uncharacterized protein (DUF1778 family)
MMMPQSPCTFNAYDVAIAIRQMYLCCSSNLGIEAMARPALDDTDRMNIRVKPEVKARLLRAAALRHTDLTSFVTQSALREAETVIAEADAIKVSERDFGRILELLDNPPKPNAKLRAAAAALPKTL